MMAHSIPRPIEIAPVPDKASALALKECNDSDLSNPTAKRYNCQTCARRKVKCDRATPICSSCSKSKLECVYKAPAPRPQKRKRAEDIYQRLAGYELILRENGLLPPADAASTSYRVTAKRIHDSITESVTEHDTPRSGRMINTNGKSQYVESAILLDMNKFDTSETSDDEEAQSPEYNSSLAEDPISGALLAVSQDLLCYYPTRDHAMKLWAIHVRNVEPLCKILHIPTTERMFEAVSHRPATEAEECLLFSIYHFAVFSITDEDCLLEFGASRVSLISKYQYAFRQALVNASWLTTTEMQVMQAYVLYLIAIRSQCEPQKYWMLTGVAVRIAQRMGLHRDGESLGLLPYDDQMRRRLFWQLLPLDGYASQISGTGITIVQNSWDVKQPLNINDDQIYPGMTHQPEEQNGASEMMFCLTKAALSLFYNKIAAKMKDANVTIRLAQKNEIENMVNEIESTIEAKYLRYCDIAEPSHLLTLGRARAAANGVRLRNRMAPLLNQSIDDQERKELCALAGKILDADTATYSYAILRRFHWQMKSFFIWDALMCILTSIGKSGFFSPSELDTEWSKMSDIYANHPEILAPKGTIIAAVGKVTLKAWNANPPSNSTPEPAFIIALRSLQKPKAARRQKEHDDAVTDGEADAISKFNASENDIGTLFGNLDGMDFNLDNNFDFGTADWIYWDQLNRG